MPRPNATTAPHAVASGETDFVGLIGIGLAVAAIGLSIHPPEKGRFTRVAATVCYVAAAEVFALKLTVPTAIRVGAGAGVLLAVLGYKVFPFRISIVRRPGKGAGPPRTAGNTSAAPSPAPVPSLPPLAAGGEETLETTTIEGGWKITRRGAERSQGDPSER